MTCPPRYRRAIDLYVRNRIHPGGFLEAVLSNDLVGAFQRADSESKAALESIVRYCYNEIPGPCWGSKARVEEHLAFSDGEVQNVDD